MAMNTAPSTNAIPLHDLHPAPSDMRAEILGGLTSSPKTLPCKYFYDERGSQLFDRICELDEYYLTRTEVGILNRHVNEIAAHLGSDIMLIELGSGTSTKTLLLLEELDRPAAYVPVDISREHLMAASERIQAAFPEIAVRPVCADFTESFSAPEILADVRERFVFFSGSTIGNFNLEAQRKLLRKIAEMCEPEGGGLLIGIDLVKDLGVLRAAYDDASGVTVDFNLNLLVRINRDLGADFELEHFEHKAFFNQEHERIEMHLVSTRNQVVNLGKQEIHLASDEVICTEHSHKFRVQRFAALAHEEGLSLDHCWMDDDEYFAVLLLRA